MKGTVFADQAGLKPAATSHLTPRAGPPECFSKPRLSTYRIMIGRPAMASASPAVNLNGSQPLSDALIAPKYVFRISADAPCVAKVMRGGAIIKPDLLKLNSTEICMPLRAAS